jgi:hypothetical protein
MKMHSVDAKNSTRNATASFDRRSTRRSGRAGRFLRRLLPVAAAGAAILGMANSAHAAVSLMLTDNDATPQAVTVNPGQSFTVTLNVVSTSEKLTGVDYYFQLSGAAAGKMSITQRNESTSLFNDPLLLDSSITGPINKQFDLGATINNVSNALSAGSYLLAQYTISVDAGLAPGTYTLSTWDPSGSGVVREAPTFNEQGFDQHALFTVNVVPLVATPEPGAAGMILLGGTLVALRRRRRA